MPTSYTNLLGLALPVTGELSGTWGNTVNDYITGYLDAAVAGTQTISGSQTAVTLSKTTNASLVSAGSGATGSSQYAIINCTGNPAGQLTITAPVASKYYLVINATSTNQSVKIVGAGPTTGVTINAATRALVAWNGSDFVLVATNNAAQLSGVLAAANGGTGQSSYAVGDILYASGATSLAKLADVATGNALISGGVGTAPSWGKIGLTTHVSGTLPVGSGGTGATTLTGYVKGTGTTAFTAAATVPVADISGTLPVANGGTGSTTLAVNNVLLGNGTSAFQVVAPGTSGNVLISNGTTWQSGVLTGYATLTGAQTLTNKRIDPRVVSATSASSLTPDVSAADMYAYTALAANLTINAPTGTPVNGTKLMFRILDNGIARTLTWNATYVAIGVFLPSTTVAGKTTYVGCVYNAAATRWDVIAVTTEF